MFTFPLPLQGLLNVPIESFTADPLLVLKKFPLVKAITQVVPGEYLIETYPLAITRPLSNTEINELHNAFVGTMEIYV